MGSTSSKLDSDLIEELTELTYFNKKEIIKLFESFKTLDKRITSTNLNEVRITHRQLQKMPELQQNPFLERLIDVFSTSSDGMIGFEDFLDMMNVLNYRSPFDLKAHYAFRLFDFDDDQFISAEDIRNILELIAVNENRKLEDEEIDYLTNAVLKEADLDKDGKLGESEFVHMLQKTPDFLE